MKTKNTQRPVSSDEESDLSSLDEEGEFDMEEGE
jgi:hypothetical protein